MGRSLVLARVVVMVVGFGTSCAEPGRSGPDTQSVSPTAAVAPGRHARAGLATVVLPEVPHVKQKPDFCGEACAEMALRRLGSKLDQDAVFDRSGVDPALGRGAYTAELKTALETIGFRVGEVWHRVPAAAPAPRIAELFAAMHADLGRGVPSIVCMHYDDRPATSEHFRLVVGYDAATDEVVYHEPAEDAGGYRRMAAARFLELWPLRYAADTWTAIRLRLEPGSLAAATPAARSPADYAQHVRALRSRLPRGFTVVVEPPFVVVGDDPPDVVRSRAKSTVRWAVDRLKQDFFAAEPANILDVWLFRNDESYRKNARELFDDEPSTPYGYYSSEHRALVMNIATGGGTLVHEIVHPFVEADFPGCPPWLNEGLGSLFEQSGEREGRIIGHTNWRLAGLQRAIRARAVPRFRALMSASAAAFYDEDRGTNYAQSRYLLYYLQQRGLLVRFYREAKAARDRDPSGYDTMRSVLGETDLDAFQARWEAWVLGLKYPE